MSAAGLGVRMRGRRLPELPSRHDDGAEDEEWARGAVHSVIQGILIQSARDMLGKSYREKQ